MALPLQISVRASCCYATKMNCGKHSFLCHGMQYDVKSMFILKAALFYLQRAFQVIKSRTNGKPSEAK
jgi:hypothetical protein